MADNLRFQIRERENSKFYPFAIIDTARVDARPIALATTREDADRAAEELNAMEEFHEA